MEINFHSYANKTNFHIESFALSLIFCNEVSSNSEVAYKINCTAVLNHLTVLKSMILNLIKKLLYLKLFNKFLTWFCLQSGTCTPVGIYHFFAAVMSS